MPNNEYEFKLIRSKRRTLSIEIKDDLSIIVKAPLKTSSESVNEFVSRHTTWIDKTRKRIANRPKVDDTDSIQELKRKATLYFKEKTSYYAEIMRLYPTALRITSAQSRFGSCSSKNSICFSYRLMLYPESAREYVIVHELAHIKYKNHGKDFYKLIESVLPDYKERNKLLK